MNHQFYMDECFTLAKHGLGTVTPNPLVGSVIVIDNKVVGRGFHAKKGENHAEINAIIDARKNGVTDFKKATLYCNLEPCCHTNKLTPPCVLTLVKEQFKRVVIANLDPNPHVSGNGVKFLRESGIEVVTSINEEIGSRLNEIFFTHIKFNRPFIHLKWAQSLDGYIGNGTKNYLSCEESLKLVHEMRLATDAVMIGRNTLNTDNPKLTTRLQNFERASKRIVLGKFSLMNKAANLFQDEFKTQTIVVTNEQLPECDNVISLNEESYQLETIVKALYKKGITSILVEGGEKLLTGFIEQKLVDRVSIFITPMLLQNGINAIHSLVTPALPFKFTNHEWLQVGRDMLFDSRISNLK